MYNLHGEDNVRCDADEAENNHNISNKDHECNADHMLAIRMKCVVIVTTK